MTEEEAKTKWCPFVRYSAAFDDYASNRWNPSPPEPVPCRCIASGCMAWRWNVTPDEAQRRKIVLEQSGGTIYPDFADGYCGLAGKP